jgi:xanthine dehydrogenase accessory factor
MRDIFPIVEEWIDEGENFAIAVVINTWGSSPREIGSWMVVSENGEFYGSVSGGCVESAVIQEALESIERERPKRIHFGVADETAWEVGLACGGEIDVYLRPFPMDRDSDKVILRDIKKCMALNNPFVLAIVLNGPDDLVGQMHLISDGGLENNTPIGAPLKGIIEKAGEVSQSQTSLVLPIQILDDEVDVFYNYYPPPIKLVIVGGVHISMALAACAKVIGYRVHVVDPRGVFGTSERFAEVDGLVHAWPDQGLEEIGLNAFTAVAVLSHDPKLDDPALLAALRSDAFYVGALGSRTTQDKRRERLLAQGLNEEQLQRLHGPIGLDLGGSSPEEIALSILAEIVSVRTGSVMKVG